MMTTRNGSSFVRFCQSAFSILSFELKSALFLGAIPVLAGAQSYTTNFTRTENPISEKGIWNNGRNVGLHWTDVRTTGGIACGTQSGMDTGIYRYNDSYAILSGFPPDQSAEGIVQISNPVSTCNQEVELLLRWNSVAGNATGYECLSRCLSSDDSYMEIVRWNGALGDFTYIARLHSPLAGVRNGDTLMATIRGNVITMYLNHRMKLQATDNTYSTGNPGIGFFLWNCPGSNTDFGFRSFTASVLPHASETRQTKELLLKGGADPQPQTTSEVCLVETREYPGKDDAMWDALYAARNGVVYTGLITEGGSAHFYSYLPSRNENVLIADMADFLGERGKGIRTSGKIHNKPVEDDKGCIYFVPMNNGAGPRNIDYTSWIGGHWMKYDPSSGKLENLGLVDEGIGCYPLAIDDSRKYLYGVGFTGYFYRFDLQKKVTRNFGRVTNWDICRDIFCDDEGNVYGCFPVGRVWKYDARREKVFDLSIRVPYDPTIFPTQLGNPMIDRSCDWRAVEWDPADRVAYGVTCGSGSLLFRFDPHEGREGSIKSLAKMCDSRFLDTERKDIPYSTLAFALDSRNKKIYFVPSARDYSTGEYVETFGSDKPHHLIRYDINAGKRIDLGEMKTPDGRRVFGCEAASVATDGTLYLCGQVELKDPGKATGIIGKIPVSLQLIIYKPE